MTNQKVLEMLMLRRACIKRALGMVQTFDLASDDNGKFMVIGWEHTGKMECTGDCQNCGMAFEPQQMMELLDQLIVMMTEKTEGEGKTQELKDWQVECKNGPLEQLAI